MTFTQKADMMFRQALKKKSDGDVEGVDTWLDKAAAMELQAIEAKEPMTDRRLA